MLTPLLVRALEGSGRFQVVQAASGASASLRLETEIEALQQEFTVTPSRTRFALRAQLAGLIRAKFKSLTGMALSAAHSNVVEGRRGFGVFRM